MREYRTSGSVGAPGERSPGATRQFIFCAVGTERPGHEAPPRLLTRGILFLSSEVLGACARRGAGVPPRVFVPAEVDLPDLDKRILGKIVRPPP